MWNKMDENEPSPGLKIVIAYDDGCSSSLAYVTGDGILYAEDGFNLCDPAVKHHLKGCIWTPLPDDYPIAFMEQFD